MGSTANKLKSEVRDWYRRHGIPLDTPQLIALSGGADSMALVYTLKELLLMSGSGTDTLWTAYFNHNLRPEKELEKETALIASAVTSWGLKLIVGQADPGEIEKRARETKSSLEDTARDFRYRFLESTREEKGCRYIVLAHHGNDQAETMVTRFFQGAGMAGLKGILPVTGDRRIRPLLSFPKKELLRCLVEEGVPWSEDSTNKDRDILRNHLRDGLIPEIDRVFPGYETSLVYLSEKITRYDNFLSRQGESIIWEEDDRGFHLPGGVFQRLDPALREYALYRIIDRLLQGERLSGGKGRRVPYRYLRPLLEEPLPDRLELSGHGLQISLNRDGLFISRS